MTVTLLFVGLSLFYGAVMLCFALGVVRERRRKPARNSDQPLVTVIVPARNEAAAIHSTLESLACQTYPTSRLQILIVDDHSTDGTGEVVQRFIDRRGLSHFRLLRHHRDGSRPTYKKAAITHAMQFARGEIILTVDGDCRVQPRWVESMVARYDADTGMVAGLVTFAPESVQTLFHKLQTLEFAGLVFAGVGAVGNHYPLICNGSNLSYRRAAFEEVGGFAGHDHLPSGDDDLLMQNLHRRTRWKIRYNLDPQSINYTRPMDTLKAFMHQRSRWASKSTHYPGIPTIILLAAIYLFYLLLLMLTPVTLAGLFSWKFYALALALKWVPEFLILYPGLTILGYRRLAVYFPLAQLLQVPYIVVAGCAGFFRLFKWKGDP